jgi:hypothetical protein
VLIQLYLADQASYETVGQDARGHWEKQWEGGKC